MIKFRTIGNFGNAATFPDMRAHTDMPLNCFVQVNQTTGLTAWATASTPKADLCVVIQEHNMRSGDLFFGERIIREGENVLAIGLESLATRMLEIGASHIVDALDNGVMTVNPGDALIPDGTGKLVVGTAPTSNAVYLLVKGIRTLPATGNGGNGPMTEPAVVAQIISV